MHAAIAHLLFATAAAIASVDSGDSSAFCDVVKLNRGCCPMCGYTWDDAHGKCVTKETPKTAYCKSLLAPERQGCCEFCGYAWETGSGKCIGGGGPTSSDTLLATFDGAPTTKRLWVTVNDPVMGGASVSSFTTVADEKIGRWTGEVKIVKSLGAPGFCTLRTAGDDRFANVTDTKFLGLHLTGGSGLPAADFSLQIAVKGVTTMQTTYNAQLNDKYCCADDCRVPWTAFQLSFRGKPVPGPPLSAHLDGITQIGLGTAGTAGPFELNISSFYGTLNATRPCTESGFFRID